jgi:serine protease Do
MKTNRNRKWFAGIVVIAGVVVLGSVFTDISARVAYALESGQASAAKTRLASVDDLSDAFEEVAVAIKPSVVNISSIKKARPTATVRRLPQGFSQSPLDEFFGNGFFDRFFQQNQSPHGFAQQGLGTGVVVSDDGYIVTNNHVVDGADEVSVRLSDDRVFDAQVIGADPKTDLAVIKVDAKNLHPANLGDSENVRIGQWVVAVGNPFGLSNTLTAGIVSAKGRSNMGIVDYEDFIQTDAAINPGNSGGPLVNLHGEVVGINTAIFTRTGGYMGLGFSIPANMVKSVMRSLIDDGHVVRGYLGVLIQDFDEKMAKSFGYESSDGALVGDVTPDGPGDKAGLKSGDIIISYDGKPIRNITQLRSLVAETKPESRTQVEIFRNGKQKTLYATIGELPSELTTVASGPDSDDLGMAVRTLTPDMAARLGMDETEGVIVTDVEPFGPAANAGLREKNVITKVQGKPVSNLDEFRKQLKRYDLADGIRLRVRTGSNERFALLHGNSSKK